MSTKLWHLDFYQQWTEIFSRDYNWKNFTVVVLTFEYSDYLRPSGYVEVHIGLFGFGFKATRIPPGVTESAMELVKSIQRGRE